MKRRTWDRVQQWAITVYIEGGEVFDDNDERVPELDAIWEDLQLADKIGEVGELTIDFRARGWSDPGSKYGGPQNVGWPPEDCDERFPLQASLESDTLVVRLDDDVRDELYGRYESRVYDAEIDDIDD